MRKILLVLLQAIFFPVMAQNAIEDYTYVSNNVVPQNYGLPTVRSVGGGTKFIVSYEGNWSYDMKGAFEYACKIWEEAMPTTFPVHIKAILDESKNITALSKVSSETKIHNFNTDKFDYQPSTGRSTWLQMKGTKFMEYTGRYNTNTYDYVLTLDMFKEPDVIITYYNNNNKIKDNCSFSIAETIDNSKYDFVTLVLRDLAKSFGLFWQYNKPQLWSSVFNWSTLTPYERYIVGALGYYDEEKSQQSMLTKATQGTLHVKGNSLSWDLYAPTTWDVQKSLSYFMPNANKKISKLLSYDFGKGSIIRDISDNYTYEIFEDLLNWRGDIAVGVHEQNNSVSESSQTTNNVIDYNGSIVIGGASLQKKVEDNFALKVNTHSPRSIDVTSDSISKIILKYHPNYNGTDNVNEYEGTISLLLNDGTWDIVYTYSPNFMRNISVSDFTMHKSNKDYARTTDGYLRCRITKTYYDYGRKGLSTTSKYYALDYLPQVAVMAKSMILTPEDEEDYYRDVEIAYKNIEGTTRIVVSQYNEGENVPLQYALSNIKSGTFTATVDKEYSTTFIITSYNKNGASTSESYVLPAITPINNLNLSFELNDGKINITGNSRRMNNELWVSSYEIVPLDITAKSSAMRIKKIINRDINSNTIDISSLDNGIYGLNVVDVFGQSHSFKFVKR